MRVLVAPDKFAGTLSAVEAAEAIATGWRRRAPGDEVETVPMADGGPGFVDVLHASLGGELLVEGGDGGLHAKLHHHGVAVRRCHRHAPHRAGIAHRRCPAGGSRGT